MSEHLVAVQQMQRYIEQHLDDDISMQELAEHVSYSRRHAYRIFKNYLSMTPSIYIRKLRLSKAAQELLLGERITDIAFKFGFGSVDGFQRAFYKEFRVNPREYAKGRASITLFDPTIIETKKGVKTMKAKKLFALLLCLVVGAGAGYFARDYVDNQTEDARLYSVSEFMSSINESYKNFNGTDLVSDQNIQGNIEISNEKTLPEKILALNLPLSAYLTNEGSQISMESPEISLFLNLGDVSSRVFIFLDEIVKQDAENLFGSTSRFEFQLGPQNFKLYLKIGVYNEYISIESILVEESEGSILNSYSSVYVKRNSLGKATEISTVDITYTSTTVRAAYVGFYNFAIDKITAIDPNYSNMAQVNDLVKNHSNKIKNGPSTLNTTVDIADALQKANQAEI